MADSEEILDQFFKLRAQAGILRVTAERLGKTHAAQFAERMQGNINDELDLLSGKDEAAK